MFEEELVSNEKIEFDFPDGIELYIKREDLLHKEISGNKFRKLKYNFKEAKGLGFSKIVTFGGAYSNHIAATAAAGRIYGMQTIGIIRGDELVSNFMNNPTLKKAHDDGMRFEFISRTEYRKRNDIGFLEMLKKTYPDSYIIPEGGTNEVAVLGCEEILKTKDNSFDVICCAVGTGGTLSGLIKTSNSNQKILGFPALKGDFLSEDIRKFVGEKSNWELNLEYHFGGYGKMTNELMLFIGKFKKDTGILLDPIYTCKMMFGIMDLIEKRKFKKGSKILAIHTGGLQGWNDSIKLKG
ncbi:1-aminocyclopropane-1-carboxylate deaminase/D-cysteine desulfhydrase [Myroides guanonis]|uniref:1-aminocyclopropane-1-carboxylate deaminase n=1 Tax=Myroides guanonis TaxID=1150112 RepID=A0A1I3MDJ0_9FLAO|nr:pyridoxal-phosphate dependent enzyme [Myroides guanonis]SFI95043.1 1-aminocyclopropane-1-carboxylate deaminase [Myroides guanonis]